MLHGTQNENIINPSVYEHAPGGKQKSGADQGGTTRGTTLQF